MIRWTDMIDPIYTIAGLTDIDLEKNEINGISIMAQHMTIWFLDEEKTLRHKTLSYEL